MLWGSSPTNPDSDGDGINDGNEVALAAMSIQVTQTEMVSMMQLR